MAQINLLEPSLGIQQIMEEMSSSTEKLPVAKQLSSTVLNASSLEDLFSALNSSSLTDATLAPDVGDGTILTPSAFFSTLSDALQTLRENYDDDAILDCLKNELIPLLENREMFKAYSGLMIGG